MVAEYELYPTQTTLLSIQRLMETIQGHDTPFDDDDFDQQAYDDHIDDLIHKDK